MGALEAFVLLHKYHYTEWLFCVKIPQIVFDSLYMQVCERPTMHLLDTPGVLPPKIESVETGMKLALCGNENYCFRKTLLEDIAVSLHRSRV